MESGATRWSREMEKENEGRDSCDSGALRGGVQA